MCANLKLLRNIMYHFYSKRMQAVSLEVDYELMRKSKGVFMCVGGLFSFTVLNLLNKSALFRLFSWEI